MKTGLVVLVLVFLASYFLGLLLEKDKQPLGFMHKSSCDLLNKNCHINNNDIEYKIGFDGTPSPLTPFNIQLTSLNPQPFNVEIEFEMEGMNMGNNVYSLKNSGDSWSADVLLPVCSLGRSDWLLRVRLISDEKVHSTEFRFSQ